MMCAQWNKLTGSSNSDYSTAVALDPWGSILVAGGTAGSYGGQTWAGDYDALLIKYDAAGNEQWAVQFGDTGTDIIRGVGADAAGNIFVAGKFAGGSINGQLDLGGTGNDGFVSKYDPDGNHQWTKVFGSSENEDVFDLTVDEDGAVYVVGVATASVNGETFLGGPQDLLLIKYDTDGALQWTRLWGSDGADIGYGVVADGMGAVYAVGYSQGEPDGQTNAGNLDIMLVKYDVGGARQWTRLHGTSANDFGRDVGLDGVGGVFVTGNTAAAFSGFQNQGGQDLVAAAFDTDGTHQWTYQLGTSGNDWGRGVAPDGLGAVYLAGYTDGALPNHSSLGGDDMIVLRLDTDGNEIWTQQLGSSEQDWGLAIAAGNGGGVYASGLSKGNFEGEVNSGGQEVAVVSICE